jgi:two-component system NtrC family sensor kinase
VKVGTRFIVALLMVLLPVMGAYMYWSVHRSTQSYVHDLARESRSTARSLSAAFDDDIRVNEWDQVDDVLRRIRPDGTEAAVFTNDGKLWHALPGFPESIKPSPQTVKSATTNEPLEFRVEADPNREWLCHVVPLGPPSHSQMGYLLVANDWTDVRQDLSERVRISVLTGLATLGLIIVLIALAVRSYISRPLAELSRRVISFSTDESAIGQRNRNDAEPVRDEVELLIGEFRKLGEELAKARADLLEKHRSEIELERRLLHSDRLATIGSLAAGLAHEIGTPMGVIRGRAEYLAHSKMEPLKTAEGLEIIIAQIDRITSIVRMLLDYSRYRESLKMTADLRPIVQRSIHLIETEATKRGVVVRTETGDHPLLIDCDPDQLQQVFVNLGINALDAMRTTGGALTVRTRTEHDNGAARVVVIFEDTGPGIPEANRGRIFDPFFTTKEPGEGTGMGLAVCQTIVQSHDGEITFESGPSGTRFFASFPRSHRANSSSLESARTNGHANDHD